MQINKTTLDTSGNLRIEWKEKQLTGYICAKSGLKDKLREKHISDELRRSIIRQISRIDSKIKLLKMQLGKEN